MIEAARETEVSAKATRRKFTAEEKRRILKAADACKERGELGALLRREGIYSSHLSTWRAAAAKRELEALAPRKRGPQAKQIDPRDRKLVEAEREIARWKKRAERAEAVVELQKKVSEILGIRLPDSDENR
jgi:transposase-like protein